MTCYRCKKNIANSETLKNGMQFVHYGYSGPVLTLCKDCFKKLQSWMKDEKENN